MGGGGSQTVVHQNFLLQWHCIFFSNTSFSSELTSSLRILTFVGEIYCHFHFNYLVDSSVYPQLVQKKLKPSSCD